MTIPTFEDRGHDPYNHVGRQVKRRECWMMMRERVLDGYLFIPSKAYRSLMEEFLSQLILPRTPVSHFQLQPIKREGGILTGDDTA